MKIKSIFVATTLCFALLSGVLTGCSSKKDETTTTTQAAETATVGATEAKVDQPTIDKIKKAGKLVMVTSADYPPYEYHDLVDGKDVIKGMDVDIANEIAKDLGVTLEIQDMNFDGLLASLAVGKADIVLAGMNPNDERKQSVDFSNIYYTAKQGIIVRANEVDQYKELSSFKDKKVGAQKGSIPEQYATQYLTESKIQSLDKLPDLIISLKTKKLDAIVVDLPVAQSYIAQNNDLTLAAYKFPAESELGNVVCIKKGQQDLVDAINTTIDRLSKDGSITTFFNNNTN